MGVKRARANPGHPPPQQDDVSDGFLSAEEDHHNPPSPLEVPYSQDNDVELQKERDQTRKKRPTRPARARAARPVLVQKAKDWPWTWDLSVSVAHAPFPAATTTRTTVAATASTTPPTTSTASTPPSSSPLAAVDWWLEARGQPHPQWGRAPLPLRLHPRRDAVAQRIRDASRGGGSSGLVVWGPMGAGKTSVVEAAIAAAGREGERGDGGGDEMSEGERGDAEATTSTTMSHHRHQKNKIIPLYLDGTVHGDDERICIQSLAKQLCERLDLTYANTIGHADNKRFVREALRTLSALEQCAVLVFENAHLFAPQHGQQRQPVLYDLLDMLHSAEIRAVVIFVTVKLAFLRMLEKRVVSRLGHHIVHVPLPIYDFSGVTRFAGTDVDGGAGGSKHHQPPPPPQHGSTGPLSPSPQTNPDITTPEDMVRDMLLAPEMMVEPPRGLSPAYTHPDWDDWTLSVDAVLEDEHVRHALLDVVADTSDPVQLQILLRAACDRDAIHDDGTGGDGHENENKNKKEKEKENPQSQARDSGPNAYVTTTTTTTTTTVMNMIDSYPLRISTSRLLQVLRTFHERRQTWPVGKLDRRCEFDLVVAVAAVRLVSRQGRLLFNVARLCREVGTLRSRVGSEMPTFNDQSIRAAVSGLVRVGVMIEHHPGSHHAHTGGGGGLIKSSGGHNPGLSSSGASSSTSLTLYTPLSLVVPTNAVREAVRARTASVGGDIPEWLLEWIDREAVGVAGTDLGDDDIRIESDNDEDDARVYQP